MYAYWSTGTFTQINFSTTRNSSAKNKKYVVNSSVENSSVNVRHSTVTPQNKVSVQVFPGLVEKTPLAK